MLHLPLVLSMLQTAEDAGPAAGEARCGEILTRIAEAGTHRGYSVSPGAIGFGEILAVGGVTPGNDSQRFNTSFAPALSASTI